MPENRQIKLTQAFLSTYKRQENLKRQKAGLQSPVVNLKLYDANRDLPAAMWELPEVILPEGDVNCLLYPANCLTAGANLHFADDN